MNKEKATKDCRPW